jgi:hypothetical protein
MGFREAKIKEAVEISSQPFSLSDIDSRLDDDIKRAIRDGDPIARYANNRGNRIILGASNLNPSASSSRND